MMDDACVIQPITWVKNRKR